MGKVSAAKPQIVRRVMHADIDNTSPISLSRRISGKH